jgi:hypothetical protein
METVILYSVQFIACIEMGTRATKCKIAAAKAAFTNKKALFISKLDFV